MNITAPLRRAAHAMPDAAAIIRADGSTITYAALERYIDRMVRHAARLGLKMGDITGLAIHPPDEATALILALGFARMGVASADPSLATARMRLIFRQGAHNEPGTVRFDGSWLDAGPGTASAAVIHDNPGAIFRIFASSDPMGGPRHVAISHALMHQRMVTWQQAFGAQRATRMIAVGLGSCWGFAAALRTLWAGGTIVLFKASDIAGAVQRHGVTAIVISPYVLRSWLDALPASAGPFPSLQSVEVGGSMLPARLRDRVMTRLCAHVISHLDSPEVGDIAAAPVTALATRPGAVGFVFPNVRVEAVDDGHNPLPPGSEGILRVQSDTAVAGYYEEVRPTITAFRDGWFYPGYVGTVWPDSLLSLSGHTSELINVGGEKISPHVIEEVLLTLPPVVDAAAFGVPDSVGLEEVWVAIVVNGRIDDAVLDGLCERFPRALAPKVVLRVHRIPRNGSGGIQRDALVRLALRIRDGTPSPPALPAV